jgi:hypothetical protein
MMDNPFAVLSEVVRLLDEQVGIVPEATFRKFNGAMCWE